MIAFEIVLGLDALAAAPFLPRGKGALILIMGGVGMLLFSILWSLLVSHARAAGASRAYEEQAVPVPNVNLEARVRASRSSPAAASRPSTSAAARPSAAASGTLLVHPPQRHPPEGVAVPASLAPTSWMEAVLADVMIADAGLPAFMSIGFGRNLVGVRQCANCHAPGSTAAGCETTRAALEAAVRRHKPTGRVVEVLCNPQGQHECLFEIRLGASA